MQTQVRRSRGDNRVVGRRSTRVVVHPDARTETPCRPRPDLLCAAMGKYDPLGDYLRRQRGRDVELSFREVERTIRALLPNAAARSEWWSGTYDAGSPEVQKTVWRAAGYEATLLPDDRVNFRSREDADATGAAEAAEAAEAG